MKLKPITASELDKKFDDGEEDILQYFDLSKAERPNQAPKARQCRLPALGCERA